MAAHRLPARWLILVSVLTVSACGSSTATGTAPLASATAQRSSPSPIGASPSASPAPLRPYTIESRKIDAPSLKGNLFGDPASLAIDILTPPDYASTTGRYPVVYVLAGFGDLAGFLSSQIAGSAAAVPPILAITDGTDSLGGGFYVNSPVSGNWEDAIVTDLVGYVDANFRTIPEAASRGIAGHSMGGSGALSLAMRHADVFGAVYALSPGLFDANGAQARLGQPDVVARVLKLQDTIAGTAPADVVNKLKLTTGWSPDVEFEWAYGTAFAPDPTSPSLMRFPFKMSGGQVVRDDALWATWEAGFGALPARIQQYKSSLAMLRGIGIDYGTGDEFAWIPQGCHYFVGLLNGAGIEVVEATFKGGHQSDLGDRLTNHMLPFMESKLATG